MFRRRTFANITKSKGAFDLLQSDGSTSTRYPVWLPELSACTIRAQLRRERT